MSSLSNPTDGTTTVQTKQENSDCSDVINKFCSNCGTEPERRLLKCTVCRRVGYCDKACQRQDWSQHKLVCTSFSSTLINSDNNIGGVGKGKGESSSKFVLDATCAPPAFIANAVANGMTAVETKMNDGEESFDWMLDMYKNVDEKTTSREDFMAKMNREMKRRGTPVMTLTTGEMSGDAPKNFALKKDAEMCFMTGNSSSYHKTSRATKIGYLNYEKEYKAYYDELVINEKEWMTFFHKPVSFYDANHTVGILHCLVQIYFARQGKFYGDCEHVLDMCEKIFKGYKRTLSLYTPHSREVEKSNKKIFHQLEFNQSSYRFKHLSQTNRIKESTSYYRNCVAYEFSESGNKVLSLIECGNQEYVPYLPSLLTMNGDDITPKVFTKLSDNKVMKMIKMQMMSDNVCGYTKEMQKHNHLFTLMSCKSCGKTESTMKEYKGCARCGKVFYCGKDCQVRHWKDHKKLCFSKK